MVRRFDAFALVAIDPRARAGLGQRGRGVHVIDAQSVVLLEPQLAVIPPRVDPAVGIVLAKDVGQPPRTDPYLVIQFSGIRSLPGPTGRICDSQ